MRCKFLAFVAGWCLVAGVVQAQPQTMADPNGAARFPHPVAVNPQLAREMSGDLGRETWPKQPDLLGFSVGYYDALRNTPRKEATDFRVEFRSGLSLLPMMAPQTFAGWDNVFQVHPMGGVEGTSDGALYGFGGFVFDIFLTQHIFLSPNEVVGLYYGGNGKRLGSFVEFRSTIEAGYRFDNNMRLTASLGHISNAGLTQHNPGTEIVSGNVYIPVDWVFGR